MAHQNVRRVIAQFAVVALALFVFGVVLLVKGNTEGIAFLVVAIGAAFGLRWWSKHPD